VLQIVLYNSNEPLCAMKVFDNSLSRKEESWPERRSSIEEVPTFKVTSWTVRLSRILSFHIQRMCGNVICLNKMPRRSTRPTACQPLRQRYKKSSCSIKMARTVIENGNRLHRFVCFEVCYKHRKQNAYIRNAARYSLQI
jgi:hypothetical protein